jgi:hypothetical protein
VRAVFSASRGRNAGVASEGVGFPGDREVAMNLFSVELKNQPGELAHFGNICAQHGVNLQLAGVTTGDHGTVLFTARAGIEFTERPALQVKVADQPGEAAKFGRKLADAGVNVEGLLEVSICQGEVVFAIAVDRLDEARKALGDQVIG